MSRSARRIRLLGAGFVAFGVIIMSAVSGLAANSNTKTFTYSVSPSSVVAGTTGQVFAVKVTNTTPPPSNISSFSVSVPTQFTVTSVALSASGSSNPNASATVSFSGQTVSVWNLDAIKRNQYATVNITTNVTSSLPNCGANSSGSWSVAAWTGGQTNGNAFVDTSTGSDLASHTTAINKTCSLSFTGQPSDVAKKTPISPAVTVTLTPTPGSPVPVTISMASGPGTLSGTLTQPTSSGVATFSDLQLDTEGTYTLQAAATGYGTATSNSFKVFADSFGGTDCSASTPPSSGSDVTVTEQQTNGSCPSVPFTLTASDDGHLVSLAKDPNAASQFEMTITWGAPVTTYPDTGTTIDLDGDFSTTNDQFTPDWCTVVNGVAQYPANPNANGYFWPNQDPDPNAIQPEQPWCVKSATVTPIDGGTEMQLTETFLGAGDPAFAH